MAENDGKKVEEIINQALGLEKDSKPKEVKIDSLSGVVNSGASGGGTGPLADTFITIDAKAFLDAPFIVSPKVYSGYNAIMGTYQDSYTRYSAQYDTISNIDRYLKTFFGHSIQNINYDSAYDYYGYDSGRRKHIITIKFDAEALGYELSVIEGAIYKNQNELDVFKKKMEKEGKLTITTDPEKQQEIERLKQSLVAVQKDKELLNINLNERESLVGGLNKRVGELEQEILKIKSDSEKQKQELEEKYKKYKEICEAFGYIDKEAKPDFSILEVD